MLRRIEWIWGFFVLVFWGWGWVVFLVDLSFLVCVRWKLFSMKTSCMK